jgi:hypothetical protein
MSYQFKPFRFGLMGAVSLLLILGSARFTPAQNSNLPNSLKPCLPTQTRLPIERVEAIAQTKTHQKVYYLLAAYPASGYGIDLVISVKQGRCQQEFFNPAGEVRSLTSTLEPDVARQLALGRYKRELQMLGRAKLQEHINQAAASSNGVFYPEDIWALRQLGFSIPKTVPITP